MTMNILRIDASARNSGSVSRDLTTKIVERYTDSGATSVVVRDLAKGLPLISEDWVAANFTPTGDRTDEQRETLALSDSLVAELEASDVIVIGLPVYNFGVPAALKAWVDQVARAGLTFKYTENGPEGLLSAKRVVLAMVSGGTEMDSSIDFATGYMRHILGFMGMTDVKVINADRMAIDAEAAVDTAHDAIASMQIAA